LPDLSEMSLEELLELQRTRKAQKSLSRMSEEELLALQRSRQNSVSDVTTVAIDQELPDELLLATMNIPQVGRQVTPLPVSTDVAIGEEFLERTTQQDIRQFGTFEAPDRGFLENLFIEPAKTFGEFGLGAISGITGQDPDAPSLSIVGQAVKQARGQPAFKTGRFVGETGRFIAEYAPATALVGQLGKLSKLKQIPNLIRQPIQATLIGGGTATGRELIDLAKGESFDAKPIAMEAAIFGFFDAVLLSGWTGIKSFIRHRKGDKFRAELERLAEKGEIPKLNELEIDELVRAVKTGEAASHIESQRLALLGEKAIVNVTEGRAMIRTNLAGETGADLLGETLLSPRTIPISHPPVYKSELQALKNMRVLPIAKGFFPAMSALLENTVRFFEKMGPETVEMWYRPVKEAEHRTQLALKEVTRQLEKRKKIDGITIRLPGIREGSSRKIDAWAVSQQAGGLDILKANGIAVPTLNEAEMGIYNWMRGVFELRFQQLQQVRKISGAPPLNKVQNYFTFFRNLRALENSGESALTVLPEQIGDQFIKAKSTAFRFGKRRTDNELGGIELDAFNHFVAYNKSALNHIELSPVIAKLDQYLNGKFIGDFSLKESNPQFYQSASHWVNFIAGKTPEIGSRSVNRLLAATNRNLTWAILSGNVRSALIQPTAIVNANTLLNPKWTLKGLGGLFSKEKRDFALKNSNVLDGRSYDTMIVSAMEAVGEGAAPIRGKLGQLGLAPLQWLDKGTALATWMGAFERGQKLLKMSQKEAINYADDVVIKSQASAAKADVAPLQRTTLGKSVTPFQTFVINQWGLISRDIFGIGGNQQITNKEKMTRFINFFTGMTLTNIFYEDIIGTFSPYPAPFHAFARELEKSGSEGKALASALLELAEFVPVVGGGARYGSDVFGAQAQFWNTLLSEIPRGVAGKRKTIRAVGTVFGIPGSAQAAKILAPFEEK